MIFHSSLWNHTDKKQVPKKLTFKLQKVATYSAHRSFGNSGTWRKSFTTWLVKQLLQGQRARKLVEKGSTPNASTSFICTSGKTELYNVVTGLSFEFWENRECDAGIIWTGINNVFSGWMVFTFARVLAEVNNVTFLRYFSIPQHCSEISMMLARNKKIKPQINRCESLENFID